MIAQLYRRLKQEDEAITKWLEERLYRLDAPVYSSVDLRYTGYKMAAVDTNLFPAGFNNLCETFMGRAAEEFKKVLSPYGAANPTVLILPESHTRNEFYWANIQALQKILQEAGAVPVVGRYPEIGIELPEAIEQADGGKIPLLSVVRKEKEVYAGEVRPDIVLLNNDFSHAFPEELCGLTQPVVPSAALGWHQRRKSDHFKMYTQLTTELAALLNLDPWIFNPLMTTVEQIDIHDDSSRDRLKDEVDKLIEQIRVKHAERHIDSEPYVFIKDNSGTYGMAITHVTSGDQVIELGRRKRNKMASGKGRNDVSDFLIQEGLPTAQAYQGQPLEPVFYLVNGQVVGNFFRIHADKSPRDNLNSRGMQFNSLCSHQIEEPSDVVPIDCDSPDKLRTVGGLLAKIASYAASLELAELKEKEAVGTDC